MHKLNVNGQSVDVVRKDIKNLHLAVYPPSGRIRVATPIRVNDDAVRMAVISRSGWIKRQQTKFADQDRQSPFEYVSGESHYYQGRRYLLNVIYEDGVSRVVVRNKTIIDLYVRYGSNTKQRERVFLNWHRNQLKDQIQPLITKWSKTMKLDAPEWGVKDMKTRWGSCNMTAKRIWLNLELVKKPTRCLEYIVVHEMVHLLERKHNDRFTSLMNTFLPLWRHYRDELNRFPLAHETWSY